MKVQRIATIYNVDMIISDNRYGCFSKKISSYFLTHQLRFQLPRGLKWSAFISEWYNQYFFHYFTKVFIPDDEGADNLSGDLTHNSRLTQHPKVCYIGPLTSLNREHLNVQENIDLLFLISGPEPQRTLLEEIIMQQLHEIPGKKIVVLGKPEDLESTPDQVAANTVIYPHLSRIQIMDLMCRSRLVVCRSGYSTIMELTALQKKALLIPTPGQTEQNYLAQYHKSSGQFFSQTQNRLDLKEAVRKAQFLHQNTDNYLSFNRINSILQKLGLED